MKMVFKYSVIVLLISISGCMVNAKTVQQVINEGDCSTDVMRGLASQLVQKLNDIKPGLMTSLSGRSRITLSSSAAAVPFIQTSALNAITKALAARPGKILPITSALRTLPQQVALYKWFQANRCRITLAARPGTSPHESGLAIDTTDYSAWRSALEKNGCKWRGSNDVVHFTCSGTKLGSTSILAFQKLWNCNNSKDKIAEDGSYGPQTESRVLKSPIEGFSKYC